MVVGKTGRGEGETISFILTNDFRLTRLRIRDRSLSIWEQ